MFMNRTGNSSDQGDHVDVDTPVARAPVASEGQPFWIIVTIVSIVIGCTFIILVALICVFARRAKSKNAKAEEKDFPRVPTEGSDIIAAQLTTSVESSVESGVESTETNNHRSKFKLRPSLSMDVEIPFHIKRQNIQPSMKAPKWSALHSPRPSIGALQPDIYRSSDSEDGGGSNTAKEVGRLWFSLLYKKDEENLIITLARANYLPGRGFCKGVRDPFVKIYLLPDEENFQQSKVRKRTLSPRFNETFNFKVSESEVRQRCLRFTVYDVDKRKIRHCLGHAVIPLVKIDLDNDTVIWRDLEKSPEVRREGELQLSLMCNPYNNKLKVTICKAQSVEGLDGGDALVYVKVQLFHGHKMVRCKRTATQNAVGPTKSELIFRETISFAVPARFYDTCSIQMTTYVSGGALSKDVPLGKVTIGPFLFSRGEQLLHWQEMVTNPRNVITRWHRLEPPT